MRLHSTSYTMLMVTCCHSECCVSSGLDFEAVGGSIVPYCLCLRGSSHCKYDMGTLLWLIACGSIQKSVHSPLWQTCKVLHPWGLLCETTVHTIYCNFFQQWMFIIFALQESLQEPSKFMQVRHFQVGTKPGVLTGLMCYLK